MRKLFRKLILSMSFVFVVGLMAPFPATVTAKTPDGIPPSQENECEDLHGKALGLCIAYCEAMDCDDYELLPGGDEGCDAVYVLFEDLTGEEPPCEVPELPGLP